ncbi:hypothetical protein AAHB54_11625, partial [Bacillus cereus]
GMLVRFSEGTGVNLREQTKLRVFRIYRETLSLFFVRRFTPSIRIYKQSIIGQQHLAVVMMVYLF